MKNLLILESIVKGELMVKKIHLDTKNILAKFTGYQSLKDKTKITYLKNFPKAFDVGIR